MVSGGERAIRFITRYLCHGEGDWYGQPFRLSPFQETLVRDFYDHDYRRALWGQPRGSGKTELAAAVAMFELVGRGVESPSVAVAAASWDQADLVFGVMRTMGKEAPIAPLVEVFDTEILLRGAAGRAFRVAAVAGTNEGLRLSGLVCDELHEWSRGKERVYTVLANACAKRAGSRQLLITTAGSDQDTLAGGLYLHGKKIDAGEADDPDFMFRWNELPPGTDIYDDDALAAIHPGVEGGWIRLEDIVAARDQQPPYEFARYFGNRWTAAPERWLPPGMFEALGRPGIELDQYDAVTLGFDGSVSRDATALVACRLKDRHLKVVKVWERPDGADDNWTIPRDEVSAVVEGAFQSMNVRMMLADPSGWYDEISRWSERFGAGRVVAFPTYRRSKWAEACARFYTGVQAGEVSHDGSPTLLTHVANARTKETPEGVYIVKPGAGGGQRPHKIDAAVAAVLAYHAGAIIQDQEGGRYAYGSDESFTDVGTRNVVYGF